MCPYLFTAVIVMAGCVYQQIFGLEVTHSEIYSVAQNRSALIDERRSQQNVSVAD